MEMINRSFGGVKKKCVHGNDLNVQIHSQKAVYVSLKDPDASYDVNDGDPDPQPRYTQLNDNR